MHSMKNKPSSKVEMIVKRVSVPIGLEELMEGLTREVLRKRPKDLYLFASEYFNKLLHLREQTNGKGYLIRSVQSVTSYKSKNGNVSRTSLPRNPNQNISKNAATTDKEKTTSAKKTVVTTKNKSDIAVISPPEELLNSKILDSVAATVVESADYGLNSKVENEANQKDETDKQIPQHIVVDPEDKTNKEIEHIGEVTSADKNIEQKVEDLILNNENENADTSKSEPNEADSKLSHSLEETHNAVEDEIEHTASLADKIILQKVENRVLDNEENADKEKSGHKNSDTSKGEPDKTNSKLRHNLEETHNIEEDRIEHTASPADKIIQQKFEKSVSDNEKIVNKKKNGHTNSDTGKSERDETDSKLMHSLEETHYSQEDKIEHAASPADKIIQQKVENEKNANEEENGHKSKSERNETDSTSSHSLEDTHNTLEHIAENGPADKITQQTVLTGEENTYKEKTVHKAPDLIDTEANKTDSTVLKQANGKKEDHISETIPAHQTIQQKIEDTVLGNGFDKENEHKAPDIIETEGNETVSPLNHGLEEANSKEDNETEHNISGNTPMKQKIENNVLIHEPNITLTDGVEEETHSKVKESPRMDQMEDDTLGKISNETNQNSQEESDKTSDPTKIEETVEDSKKIGTNMFPDGDILAKIAQSSQKEKKNQSSNDPENVDFKEQPQTTNIINSVKDFLHFETGQHLTGKENQQQHTIHEFLENERKHVFVHDEQIPRKSENALPTKQTTIKSAGRRPLVRQSEADSKELEEQLFSEKNENEDVLIAKAILKGVAGAEKHIELIDANALSPDKAATKLQSAWRGYAVRKINEREKTRDAIIKIQAFVRGFLTRRRRQRERNQSSEEPGLVSQNTILKRPEVNEGNSSVNGAGEESLDKTSSLNVEEGNVLEKESILSEDDTVIVEAAPFETKGYIPAQNDINENSAGQKPKNQEPSISHSPEVDEVDLLKEAHKKNDVSVDNEIIKQGTSIDHSNKEANLHGETKELKFNEEEAKDLVKTDEQQPKAAEVSEISSKNNEGLKKEIVTTNSTKDLSIVETGLQETNQTESFETKLEKKDQENQHNGECYEESTKTKEKNEEANSSKDLDEINVQQATISKKSEHLADTSSIKDFEDSKRLLKTSVDLNILDVKATENQSQTPAETNSLESGLTYPEINTISNEKRAGEDLKGSPSKSTIDEADITNESNSRTKRQTHEPEIIEAKLQEPAQPSEESDLKDDVLTSKNSLTKSPTITNLAEVTEKLSLDSTENERDGIEVNIIHENSSTAVSTKKNGKEVDGGKNNILNSMKSIDMQEKGSKNGEKAEKSDDEAVQEENNQKSKELKGTAIDSTKDILTVETNLEIPTFPIKSEEKSKAEINSDSIDNVDVSLPTNAKNAEAINEEKDDATIAQFTEKTITKADLQKHEAAIESTVSSSKDLEKEETSTNIDVSEANVQKSETLVNENNERATAKESDVEELKLKIIEASSKKTKELSKDLQEINNFSHESTHLGVIAAKNSTPIEATSSEAKQNSKDTSIQLTKDLEESSEAEEHLQKSEPTNERDNDNSTEISSGEVNLLRPPKEFETISRKSEGEAKVENEVEEATETEAKLQKTEASNKSRRITENNEDMKDEPSKTVETKPEAENDLKGLEDSTGTEENSATSEATNEKDVIPSTKMSITEVNLPLEECETMAKKPKGEIKESREEVDNIEEFTKTEKEATNKSTTVEMSTSIEQVEPPKASLTSSEAKDSKEKNVIELTKNVKESPKTEEILQTSVATSQKIEELKDYENLQPLEEFETNSENIAELNKDLKDIEKNSIETPAATTGSDNRPDARCDAITTKEETTTNASESIGKQLETVQLETDLKDSKNQIDDDSSTTATKHIETILQKQAAYPSFPSDENLHLNMINKSSADSAKTNKESTTTTSQANENAFEGGNGDNSKSIDDALKQLPKIPSDDITPKEPSEHHSQDGEAAGDDSSIGSMDSMVTVILKHKESPRKPVKAYSTSALEDHVELLDQVQNSILDQISGKEADPKTMFDLEQLREQHDSTGRSDYAEDNVQHERIITPVRELSDIAEETETKDEEETGKDSDFIKLQDSGEMHDCVLPTVGINYGSYLSASGEEEGSSSESDKNLQDPAGVQAMTSQDSPRPHQENMAAQAPLTTTTVPQSNNSIESARSIEKENMENQAARNFPEKNGEEQIKAEAATRIQAQFRGYQVRKEIKTKGPSDHPKDAKN